MTINRWWSLGDGSLTWGHEDSTGTLWGLCSAEREPETGWWRLSLEDRLEPHSDEGHSLSLDDRLNNGLKRLLPLGESSLWDDTRDRLRSWGEVSKQAQDNQWRRDEESWWMERLQD